MSQSDSNNDDETGRPISFRIPEERKEQIKDQLEYGDSISEFIREALFWRLDHERDGEEWPPEELET